MRKFLLPLLGVALSVFGLLTSTALQAQTYQPGCGNDSQENHDCKKKNNNSCPINRGSGQDDSDDADGGGPPDPDDSDDDDTQDCDDTGANPINPAKANHHREVTDIQTFGAAPISFIRNVNSRTTDFNDPYWELGYKQVWQHNWNYETRQLSTKTYGFFDIKVRYPDGNDYNFKATDATGAQLAPSADNGDRLYKWTGSTVGYTLVTSDGKELDFWRYLSPKFHLTQMRNGLGFSWSCTYDSNQQLTKITNNFGRWIQITHEIGQDGVLRIHQVSTSDGRIVTYGYSQWATSGKYVLTGVSYPGGEQAAYTYVTSDPNNSTARPLLLTASDPSYQHGKPGAQMKYVYNYNSLAFGSVITGTLMEERSSVTDQTIVSFPLGSGSYPEIQEGDGTLLTRKYTNGLLTTKGDGEGRITTFSRDTNGFGFVDTKTEPTGATTQYNRDYAGRVLSRTDALGHVRSHSFNPKGFILTKTDELNHTITWTRDSSNRRTRKDYPDSSYETWTYNANSQPISHGLRNGSTESFTYDSLGNKTSHTDSVGNVTHYTYYTTGLLASTQDGRSNTTTYVYDWRGQPLTVTHPDNSTITYQYDSFGNRMSVTDELGRTRAYTYDEYNRVKTVTDPLGRTTTYEYGRAPGCNVCSYMNTLTRITSPGGRVTTYSYDASGLRTCQTIGAGTNDAATTIYGYDAAKNLVTMTDPRGKVWHYTYDDKHRKLSTTDPLGNVRQWTYDEHGNKLSETRPDNGITQFQYDGRNRLTQTTDPAGHATRMTYDNADNLLTLQDARNNVYTFGYDALNRKTSLTYPDTSHEDYTYDAVGNVATYTTRARQVKTSAYDNRNRETGFDWNDGTDAVAQTYDAAGRLLTLENNASLLSYTYDDANQLTSETQQIKPDQAVMSFSFSYDDDGQRTTMSEPSGDEVAYHYTARGQVSEILDGSPLADYIYDLNGNRMSRSIADNATETDYSYDDANRLLTVDHRQGQSSFARFDYNYNAVGNRTSRQSTVNNQPSTDLYGYDAVDQVTEVKYNFDAGTNMSDRDVSYNYDVVGNRSGTNGVTDSVSGNTSYASNNLNQYIAFGAGSPQYDGNGNLTMAVGGGADWTYQYDAQNRLVSASRGGIQWAFAYDGRNRCVSRTRTQLGPPGPNIFATTYFYYENWNLIEESANGGNTARYIHGTQSDEILKSSTVNEEFYYHQDALGSTIAVTDGDGNVIERYQYDVYGAPSFFDSNAQSLNSSVIGNRFLFTGREYLSEMKLYDYRDRIYSAQFGRLLQTDRLGFGGGDINLYRYVTNNPIKYIDPSGDGVSDIIDWLLNLFKTTKNPSEPTTPGKPGITTPGAVGGAAVKIGYGLTCADLYTRWRNCVCENGIDDSTCQELDDARQAVCEAAAKMPNDWNP